MPGCTPGAATWDDGDDDDAHDDDDGAHDDAHDDDDAYDDQWSAEKSKWQDRDHPGGQLTIMPGCTPGAATWDDEDDDKDDDDADAAAPSPEYDYHGRFWWWVGQWWRW